MRTRSNVSVYIMHSSAWAVFFGVAFIAASSAFNSTNERQSQTLALPRAFSFAERAAYQRAIEDVYWRHRIWPRENPDPKPSLDAVMSQAQLENKVRGYLHDSLVLEDYWQRPITAEQLQAEMDRMARDTKQPEVLRELFEALGNDPAVIAECLARLVLAERLIAELSAQERTRHVESPHADGLRAMSVATTLGQVVYTLPEIANACTDQWGATSTTNAPHGRSLHVAVWTGSEMIVWAGGIPGTPFNTGGRYDPSTDSWTATSTINAPTPRDGATAVWTGTEMIVWGGHTNIGPPDTNTGGRYNPGTNSWTATSTTNAPSGRARQTAVWTGSEMIVWGGDREYTGGDYLNTGGRYHPGTNTWTATSTTSAPSGRSYHTAVWTGSEMIVWGGVFYDGSNHFLSTGGRYNPSTNTWATTSTINVPSPRGAHTAVWTGSEMIVWGGNINSASFNTGGGYNPDTNSWTSTNTIGAPSPRTAHTAVWTGSEMIVWGGSEGYSQPGGFFNTGGRYNPGIDSWTATSTSNAPSARAYHREVWTGSEMIVWGGQDQNVIPFDTGGRYCAQPQPLTIIQPNGGEVWLMGSVHQIKWDRTNLKHSDHLIIQYSRDGGASWFRIAQVPAFTFGYWWQVDNFPTTQGRVKVVLQGNWSITDQSDANFTVQRRPYITLLRPNGGEVFPIGQYKNIHWSRQNPGGNTVDIDYSTDNGTTWIRIATQAADTGWYFWHIPGPATTTAKVRIRFHETPSVTDTSEAVFTIVE